MIGSATATASSNFCFLSGSAASAALTPRYTFSHTRGTPNITSGCTSRAYTAICAGSGQQVIVNPRRIPL